MAIKKQIEIDVDTSSAEESLEEIKKLLQKSQDEAKGLSKNVDELTKSSKESEKGIKGIAKSFKGVGLAIKALGIGLLLEAFSKLKEIFTSNQKVADALSTAFNALNIVFNDLFNFLFDNFDNVKNFFKEIFENPQEKIAELGQLLRDNLTARFEGLLELIPKLGKALDLLFSGEFSQAAKVTADAFGKVAFGVESVTDVASDAIDAVSELVDKGTDYLVQTVAQAKANVELENTAKLATAQQARLVEQYDRLAEKQRQLRDDETNSISERIKANEKLNDVLSKQEEALIKQANLQIAAAKNQLNLNDSIDNRVALTDALANKEGILAQIEGFRSEQLINRISLEKEAIELNNIAKDSETERALLQLDFNAQLEDDEVRQLELQRLRLEQERLLVLSDLETKTELYKQGTLARVEAEQEYLTKKQEIDNALLLNEQQLADKRIEIDEKLFQAKQDNLGKTGEVLNAFTELAGENTVAGKGFAVAEATISTYRGVSDALAAKTVTPFETALKFANAAAIAVSGFKNVKDILSVKIPNASSGGVSAPSGSQAQAPAFNLVEGTGSNQIAQGLANETQPIKAFVVSSDVSTGQSLDRNVIENASL